MLAIDVREVDLSGAEGWWRPGTSAMWMRTRSRSDVAVEFFEQIPMGALLMVEVVKNLEARA